MRTGMLCRRTLTTSNKIDFTLIPEAEYPVTLRQMAVTGTLPDVLCLWEYDIVEFVKAGYVIPLDQYVAKSPIVSVEDFIPATKELMAMQKGLYGLPWCYATHVLYYKIRTFSTKLACLIPMKTGPGTIL